MDNVLIRPDKILLDQPGFHDLDSTQILINSVCSKIEKLGKDLPQYHFYSVKLTKIPTRIDYHLFSLEKLSEISRKLINGQNTLGTITNRSFWSRYFFGGFRLINVSPSNIDSDLPSFTINYIVFSENDNLDIKILKNLTSRIKYIDPSLILKMEYLGKYSRDIITKSIPEFQHFEYSPEIVNKLGQKTIYQIQDLEYQTPKYFGRLFKSNSI